jgi:hypothetical protein
MKQPKGITTDSALHYNEKHEVNKKNKMVVANNKIVTRKLINVITVMAIK